jgi:hypothetical protein
MSRSLGHLIVISPRLRSPWKTQVNHKTLAAAGFAMGALLLFVVVMGYTFPPAVDHDKHTRLEAENQVLRVENKNLGLKMQKLATRVEKLEELSWGVVGLMGGD